VTKKNSTFHQAIDRRSVLKAGVASSGLIAASRFGGVVSAQDATPSAGGGMFTSADYQPAAPVEIEYWQYELGSKTDLVNELIPEFQEANPNITIQYIVHGVLPYRRTIGIPPSMMPATGFRVSLPY